MRSTTILLFALCLLAAACQKRKYPEDQVKLGSQDIFVNGTVDNEPFTLKIGENGYYCYSAYKQAADSVYLFEGTLKKYDCYPCPQSLSVQLSDYRQRIPGSAVDPDSSFRGGSRVILPGMTRAYSARFFAHANQKASTFSWQTSTGRVSQDSIADFKFDQPGPQTVSLTVRTAGNCESVAFNKIFLNPESGLFACSIEAENTQPNSAIFHCTHTGGRGPYRYSWKLGDGKTSDDKEPSNHYTYAGSYPVKLTVYDADNHACESNFIYVTAGDKSSCAANMSQIYTGSSKAVLNGVRIQWTDQSNAVLRSDGITQPAGSYFEILKSQPYAANEKGEAGRLLTLRYNVLLSDGMKKVWFKSDNTQITVAYK